ncbi:MAG: flagellin, partial [Lacipirellulaceae bacterium]
QQEIDASLDAFDRVASGSDRVGNSGSLGELRTGGSANVVDGDIEFAATLVESKTSSLNRTRAAIAAYERTQLDTFDRIRENQIVITTEALSQIEDADFAQESANFVQGQILSRAAAEALTFSTNELREQLESLLDGIEIKS